jgi:hypothetical protein
MSESKTFTGDVFTCQKQLSGLLKCNNAGDAATVERVHIMLSKFTNESFIPVEYAEKLLTSVGNLMERCSDEDVLVNFASNNGFTTLLISIISDFTMRIAPTSPMKSISPSSFSSHYCYELSLFMLLGLLDKTKVLKVFVRTVTPARIEKLISSVCSIITRDQLYLTQVIVFGVLLQSSLNSFLRTPVQEVGLESVCRLGHYLLQHDADAFHRAMKTAPHPFRDAIARPAQIPALLRDMRPLLNKINEDNPNVFSHGTSSFTISTTWRKVDIQREVHSNGWLDLCRDAVCYNLLEDEVLIRFSYQAIKKIHFSEDNNSIQVL